MFEWTIIFKNGVIYKIIGDEDSTSFDGSTWNIFRNGKFVGMFDIAEIVGRERREVAE